MRYTYEVTIKDGVKVWDNENPNELNAPFFHQPTWPNETPWNSIEEAEEWALLFIESLENPESEFVPGEGPENPSSIRQAI